MPAAYKELTAKQEAWVRAYLDLGNGTEAYNRLYNTRKSMSRATCARAAAALLDNPKIQARLAQLKQEQALAQAKRTARDVQWYMDKLEAGAQRAWEKGDLAAFERMTMDMAKLDGLLVDKAEVRTGAIDPDEAKPDIAQLWDRVRGADKGDDNSPSNTTH